MLGMCRTLLKLLLYVNSGGSVHVDLLQLNGRSIYVNGIEQ